MRKLIQRSVSTECWSALTDEIWKKWPNQIVEPCFLSSFGEINNNNQCWLQKKKMNGKCRIIEYTQNNWMEYVERIHLISMTNFLIDISFESRYNSFNNGKCLTHKKRIHMSIRLYDATVLLCYGYSINTWHSRKLFEFNHDCN